MTSLATVGFLQAESFFASTDLDVLPKLTKNHTPVGLLACFEGQMINYLQTVYGVIDFKGGYTDEIRGPDHGSEVQS